MKEKILNLFEQVMPKTFKWHKKELSDIIDVMLEKETDPALWQGMGYTEEARMKFCNDLADFIKTNVVDKKDNPHLNSHLQKRNPKDEYDKGVLSCLGAIYFIQHCMHPS